MGDDGFYLDYMGHWRPPPVWQPSLAPEVRVPSVVLARLTRPSNGLWGCVLWRRACRTAARGPSSSSWQRFAPLPRPSSV